MYYPFAKPTATVFFSATFIFGLMSACALSARADNAPAPTNSFAGRFSDEKLTVEFHESAGGYAGTISLGGKDYPAKATASDHQLRGSFVVDGTAFDFTAVILNNRMTLVSEGHPHSLARIGGAAGDDMPVASVGGFSLLGQTSSGETLFIKLPNAATLESAITETADELGKVLDAKPDVAGAFADSKTKSHGGALFTGKMKGRDIRGWIFTGLPKAGGNGAVTACAIVAATNAPAEDVQTLFAFLPAQLTMKQHDFPDGSGSVDLPTGWTSPSQSIVYGGQIVGPASQRIIMGNSVVVHTPDGNMVQMVQKNYQLSMNLYQTQMQGYQQSLDRHRRFPNIPAMPEPRRPEPPNLAKAYPGAVFCRVCSGAEEVLNTFYPIAEKQAKEAGGPYTTLDKIIEIVPAPSNPMIPNDKAGVAYLAVTDHEGDKTTSMRVLVRIETYPILDGKDSWAIALNMFRAPDATFDRDLPLMYDIMGSFKMNMNVVQKKMAADGEVIRKMADDNQRLMLQRGKDFNRQQANNFDRFEAQMRAQSQARHDSNSDFIEYIRGVRTVYNTRTGESAEVNLSNVHAVVGALNAAANDPNENVEIPLRYQR